MRISTALLLAWLAAVALVEAPNAVAQVPKHAPGSICFTPRFWCWATPVGKPNAACTCPTPYGAVRGTLG